MRPVVRLNDPQVSSTLKSLSTCFVIAAHTGLWAALWKKMRVRDAIIAAGVSGAGGVVVGALCVYGWGPDRWYLTCAACGVAGWAGGNVVLDKLTFVAWTLARGYAQSRAIATGKPRLDVKFPEAKPDYEYPDLGLPPTGKEH